MDHLENQRWMYLDVNLAWQINLIFFLFLLRKLNIIANQLLRIPSHFISCRSQDFKIKICV